MRMIAKHVCVSRPAERHLLYKMLKHEPSTRNGHRDELLFTSIGRMHEDGLSNLAELGVEVVDVRLNALFMHLKINVRNVNSSFMV